MSKESLEFQTEVSQLLNLMIHSLYSNRDIFLRELISNSSDACDKLRVESLADDSLFEKDSTMKILVEYDEKARTIKVIDNGVGMSKDEIIANLGTIAKSGTKEFFGKLSGDAARDSALIGQFGVGFYSCFIVAEKVIVKTRRAGLPPSYGVCWESNGVGGFSIESLTKKSRGTEITLFLRSESAASKNGEESAHDDLLSHWKLQEIIAKYSDHIAIPIMMKKRTWDEKKSIYVEQDELEQVNKASAIWTRAKQQITEEQYEDFFKTFSGGNEKSFAYSHNKVEGRTEYTQLLFIPGKAPFDLYDRQQRHGLKLYIKRVFIMDDAEQLLPNYLRFVGGVVDSNDLPLNVSREILQESRDVKAIREGCAKRILALLAEISKNDPEKYLSFWNEFGQCLKEGFGEDFTNKDRLLSLVRFRSTFGKNNELTSLQDYVARMKSGQEKIFLITGETIASVLSSPHLEIFNQKGIEVLLLVDRVDEWVLNFVTEFEGKHFQSITKGSIDLDKVDSEDENETAEKKRLTDKQLEPLLVKAKVVLGDKVKDVKISKRLTDSACCLISDENDVSGHLERLLKSAGQKAPERKPILELNSKHPLVEALVARADDETSKIVGSDGKKVEQEISTVFSDLVLLLFDQALLSEGGQPDNPTLFVKRLNGFLLDGLSKR